MLTNSYSIRDAPRSREMTKKVSYEKLKFKKRVESKSGAGYIETTTKTTTTRHLKDINDSDGYQGDMGDANYHANEVEEFIDDEISLFKNETLSNVNKLDDYRKFKKPLIPDSADLSTSNLHFNKMIPISMVVSNEAKSKRQNQIANEVRVKNHQKKTINELKVFTNLSNTNSSIQFSSVENQKLSTVPNELPKNSTPIYTGLNLNAKHKNFLNAKLNLTILPPSQQQLPQINENKKSSNSPINQMRPINPSEPKFYLPQVNNTEDCPPQRLNECKKNEILGKQFTLSSSSSNAISYKTSTLKSNSNILSNGANYNCDIGRKVSQHILPTDTLNVSKISAMENATSTNSCVVVLKAEMSKDIKKSLKDEFKKDKSKCSIQ